MNTTVSPNNFIRTIVEKAAASGVVIRTRFPPEPNGYLHIGHAKSICLNFELAREYGDGLCHLRLDDSNPENEKTEYVEGIMEDVRWLGFDWGDRLFYASDYYEQLYKFAVHLIKADKAYVDSLTLEQIREYRGTLTESGRNSPYRERSVEENLALFKRMREGEFTEGEYCLRAKIDMAAPNINLRDPVIYRIKQVSHYRTDDKWCIYPMYDFTHCLSDALEGITHSLCTLEFEDHRPLYEWYLENLPVPAVPRQIEFARLNLSYTVTSKRKLAGLVADGVVDGWDDPRLPTIRGMRRRGYPPSAIVEFCRRIGVTKQETLLNFAMLESCVREALDVEARRVLGVLKPLKVVIENYPEGESELLSAPYHPARPELGARDLLFSKTLYVEQADFMEDPPKKFFRLALGREVRLRYGYFITCVGVVRDSSGGVVELRCRYDPETRGGNAPDGRKVKGTIHWVSAAHAVAAEVKLYDRLFTDPQPDTAADGLNALSPQSLEVVQAFLEPSLGGAKAGENFQFERLGYFCVDSAIASQLSFNRIVTLRDSWAKRRY